MLPVRETWEAWQPEVAIDSVLRFMSSVGLVHFWFVSVAGLPSPESTERLNSQRPGRKSGSCSAASAGRARPAKRKAAAVRMEANPLPLRQSIVCPPREPVEEGHVGRGGERQV